MILSRLIPSRPLLLAAAAGAAATLSFAPFGWWPLQFIVMAILFVQVDAAATVRQAALRGWAFSFGWSACGIWWLFVSMHRYGGLPAWMAAAAVVLLALALGAFAGVTMGAGRWLQQRGASRATMLLVALPALWMLAEWLRGWMFTGFPWVASGYAHTEGVLTGFAPVLGVYGIGWLAALLAGCLVLRGRRAIAVAIVVVAAGLGLRQVAWTEAHGNPVSVRLVQGNVPQEFKFAHEQVQAALDMYQRMITETPADLIATPETALPMLAHRLPAGYLPALQQFATQSGSHVVLGVPVSDGHDSYANSALGLAPQSQAAQSTQSAPLYRYDKHHLVPFGEFIPPGARWFVQMMNIPLGDFTRGRAVQPAFAVRDQQVLPNICYEDLFGEEIAVQLADAWHAGKLPATILLNMSNIAWFGDTIALPQHLQISRMRSLETGRPMLRATNTGVTAIIDQRGTVLAQLPAYQRATLAARVQGMQGWTPYMLAGNVTIVTLAVGLLLAAWLSTRRASVSGAVKTR
ncbi:apolipoprotein N-acyltransferase [Lacisediminimonas profundi]|uniref:apolipoprotein N-acyltransferase n=1 Tax=Lacisediminimonas profundi TaxID=2603856 RepID=UPI001F4F301A|nr:apolipoprotein N-acyltransferase [Lacisediminimonas profundi]